MTSSGAPPTVPDQVRIRPQTWQALSEADEFFSGRHVTYTLDALDKTVNPKLRVHFAKQVNLVWHDFQGADLRSIL